MEEQNKLFYKQLIRTGAISLLVISFFVTMYQAILNNPDSDSYWLIATGRYIVENHTFPKINPWTNGNEIRIVIQQPICAILNYMWFSITHKFGTLWQLATIMNAVMLMAMLYLSRQLECSYSASFLGMAIVEIYIIVAGMNITRPFQFTITMSCILIANLEKAKRNKSYKRAVIAVALLTIWQANYQMASLIAIPLFVSCYTVGGICSNVFQCIKTKDRNKFDVKFLLKGLSLYIVWFVCSLINPYGLNGAMYLYNSREAMGICRGNIYELQTYSIWSIETLLIFIVFFVFFVLYSKYVCDNFEKVFLVCGCVLAAAMVIRNFWMIIVSAIFVFPPFIQKILEHLELHIQHNKTGDIIILKDKEKNRVLLYIRVATILIAAICCFLSFSSQSLFDEQTEAFISEIQRIPEDATIFTNFGTGALVEYAGRKIYFDARPELFSPAISGGENRLEEFMNIYNGGASFLDEFMKNNKYDYYVITPYGTVYNHLALSGQGELIYMDYVFGYCIVKRVE